MKHKHRLLIADKPRGPKALYFRCDGCGKVKGFRRDALFDMLTLRIPFRRSFQIYGAYN